MLASMSLTLTLPWTPLRRAFSSASSTALGLRSPRITESTPSTSRASLTPLTPDPHMGSQATTGRESLLAWTPRQRTEESLFSLITGL